MKSFTIKLNNDLSVDFQSYGFLISLLFLKTLVVLGVISFVVFLVLVIISGVFLSFEVLVVMFAAWGMHILYLWHRERIASQRISLAKITEFIKRNPEQRERIVNETNEALKNIPQNDRYYIFGEFLIIYQSLSSSQNLW